MTEIAVLTPDPADQSYASHWPGVLARLEEALSGAGVRLVPLPWTEQIADPSRLGGFPLVLPVVVWGYHRDHGRWLQACAAWTAAGVPLANPASVLAWNSDKTYLRRLGARGVPIPETLWLDHPSTENVAAAAARFGEIVVKPVVSGGAWRTQRLKAGDAVADLPAAPAMVQPFLPAIEGEGELSLLHFGRRFSHAVRKTAAPGDFRIQVQFGGRYDPEPAPPAAALEVAAAALAAVEEPLLYARVDLVRDPAGQYRLMELELIEPDFYLSCDPRAGAGFAEAVRERLG